MRLAAGNAECQEVIGDALSSIISGMLLNFRSLFGTSTSCLSTGKVQTLKFDNCPFLNQSVCGPTTNGTKENNLNRFGNRDVKHDLGENQVIVVYNDLGQNRSEYLSIPVLAVWHELCCKKSDGS